MSDKERNAVENVVRGRQPVLVALPVKHTNKLANAHTHSQTHIHIHTHKYTRKHAHTLTPANTVSEYQLAQVELSEDEVDEPAEVEEEEERNILEPQVCFAHTIHSHKEVISISQDEKVF